MSSTPSLPLDAQDVGHELTDQLRPHQLPCRCGQPSTWCHLPEGIHEDHPDRWCCDICVPRGCPCQSTEAYQEACDLAEEDGRAPPAFDPQRHGRRDLQQRLLPCAEWWPLFDEVQPGDAADQSYLAA